MAVAAAEAPAPLQDASQATAASFYDLPGPPREVRVPLLALISRPPLPPRPKSRRACARLVLSRRTVVYADGVLGSSRCRWSGE